MQESSKFSEREGSEHTFKGLSQFNTNPSHKKIFRDLTERYEIDTNDYEVINITITYGSKFAVAIVKDSNLADKDHFEIIGYSLNSFK